MHQYLQGSECMFTFVIKKGHQQRQHPCTKHKAVCLFLDRSLAATLLMIRLSSIRSCNGKERHSSCKGNMAKESMDRLSARLVA